MIPELKKKEKKRKPGSSDYMAAWIGSQETLGSNLILLFINYVALGKFVNLLELHFFCQMGIIPA